MLEQDIIETCRTIDGWTSPEQAMAMAACIVALRPALSVEIGVYAGRGLKCMALAHRSIGVGMVVGIDAYNNIAAITDQPDSHREFWGDVDLTETRRKCEQSIAVLATEGCCRLVVATTSNVTITGPIGVLRIDGNHGEQSISDVIKFSPLVQSGGFIFLDDVEWPGGSVIRAAQWLDGQGWRKLYNIGQTVVYQR